MSPKALQHTAAAALNGHASFELRLACPRGCRCPRQQANARRNLLFKILLRSGFADRAPVEAKWGLGWGRGQGLARDLWAHLVPVVRPVRSPFVYAHEGVADSLRCGLKFLTHLIFQDKENKNKYCLAEQDLLSS